MKRESDVINSCPQSPSIFHRGLVSKYILIPFYFHPKSLYFFHPSRIGTKRSVLGFSPEPHLNTGASSVGEDSTQDMCDSGHSSVTKQLCDLTGLLTSVSLFRHLKRQLLRVSLPHFEVCPFLKRLYVWKQTVELHYWKDHLFVGIYDVSTQIYSLITFLIKLPDTLLRFLIFYFSFLIFLTSTYRTRHASLSPELGRGQFKAKWEA